MKWNRMVIALGALVLIGSFGKAFADSQEPIDLKPIPITIPEPVKDPRPVIVTEHDLNKNEVDKLARLLWSSPLRSEWYKKQLVWVVMNRAAYGEPFDSTISGCVNTHEFAFFDAKAHKSNENLRIVREAMNEWYSREEGNNAGVVIPRFAFFIRFTGTDNRQLQLLDINRLPLG